MAEQARQIAEQKKTIERLERIERLQAQLGSREEERSERASEARDRARSADGTRENARRTNVLYCLKRTEHSVQNTEIQ